MPAFFTIFYRGVKKNGAGGLSSYERKSGSSAEEEAGSSIARTDSVVSGR